MLGCEVVVDKKINNLFKNKLQLAKEVDWKTEYLSPKISIKTVDGVKEAVSHIINYGTMHTDSIVTKNKKLFNHCKKLRKYGMSKLYYSDMHGINSRLDEIHASILNFKLKK